MTDYIYLAISALELLAREWPTGAIIRLNQKAITLEIRQVFAKSKVKLVEVTVR